MTIVNQIITLDDAIARNLDTWDVMFNDFGYNSGSGQVVVYPIPGANTRGLPTVFGVAIGPRSLLDRCLVLWDPQVVIQGSSIQSPDFYRRLNRRAPLMYPQAGNKDNATGASVINPITALRFGADAAALGTSGNLNDATVRTPTTFTPEGTAVETTLLPVNDPLLQLLFFLKPPFTAPPLCRFEYDGAVTKVLSGDEVTEQYIGSFPVMGRDNITIHFETTGGTVAFRVGGHRCSNSSAPREVTLATSASVTTNNPDRIKLERPGVDWLNVFATITVTSPLSGGTVAVRLRAEDV